MRSCLRNATSACEAASSISASLRQARIDTLTSEYQLRGFAESLMGTVEQTYWDLYAAERDYAVQKLTRDRAEAFLKETETRAKTGLVGPNQVANARTFLAEQEVLLLDREEQLDRLSDQLSSLIGMRPDTGKSRFISVDTPPDDFPIEEGLSVTNEPVVRPEPPTDKPKAKPKAKPKKK